MFVENDRVDAHIAQNFENFLPAFAYQMVREKSRLPTMTPSVILG